MNDKISSEEQVLLDKFLANNQLWLGPDPEIMRNHSTLPRTPAEDEILKKGLDPHEVHHVRGLINAALSEAFAMCNQMGAAPGAKRSEEHTSELQSLMRISYAVFCLKKKSNKTTIIKTHKQCNKQ